MFNDPQHTSCGPQLCWAARDLTQNFRAQKSPWATKSASHSGSTWRSGATLYHDQTILMTTCISKPRVSRSLWSISRVRSGRRDYQAIRGRRFGNFTRFLVFQKHSNYIHDHWYKSTKSMPVCLSKIKNENHFQSSDQTWIVGGGQGGAKAVNCWRWRYQGGRKTNYTITCLKHLKTSSTFLFVLLYS